MLSDSLLSEPLRSRAADATPPPPTMGSTAPAATPAKTTTVTLSLPAGSVGVRNVALTQGGEVVPTPSGPSQTGSLGGTARLVVNAGGEVVVKDGGSLRIGGVSGA